MTNKLESIMVKSSAIFSAEYNTEEKEMMIYFNSGSIYKYHSVPLFTWRGLFNSKSKGKFLNHFVFKEFNVTRIDL